MEVSCQLAQTLSLNASGCFNATVAYDQELPNIEALTVVILFLPHLTADAEAQLE